MSNARYFLSIALSALVSCQPSSRPEAAPPVDPETASQFSLSNAAVIEPASRDYFYSFRLGGESYKTDALRTLWVAGLALSAKKRIGCK